MEYSEKVSQALNQGKMSRLEIASAVERIVAAVAVEYGLVDGSDPVSLGTRLHDDLGMDELDVMEVMFRAESRFGNGLPDDIDAFSSVVGDIVDLVAERVGEREATYGRPDLRPV